MRTMLPLALTLATLVACSRASDQPDETAVRQPARDLTLQDAVAPQATVASAVELDRPGSVAVKPKARRAVRRPKPASAAPTAVPQPAPVAEVPVLDPQPLPIPASFTVKSAATADPYALEPGETVTVLPASGGTPSPAGPADPVGERPADARGTGVHIGGTGGGSCGGRGGGRHPGGLRGLC
jgi:hypothetical protein